MSLVVFVSVALNAAVMPVGRPETARVTGMPKFNGLTTRAIVLVALAPRTTVMLLGDNERLKLGVGTMTVTVVEAVTVAELPVIVIGCEPGVAVAPAVKVSILYEVLLIELK
jgi:hypothetical protein